MVKDILKEIIQKKKEKIILAKQAISEEELKNKAQGLPEARPFLEAIKKPKAISLIAEIKKASPSRGVIREDFIPQDIARIYEEAGAQAISVLTEEDYFLGNLAYLNEVKSAVNLPILRKDFILEPYQVYESRVFGADAILFIADLLSKDRLTELMQLADNLGLDYIVEVHTDKELKKVLTLKNISCIGINSRNLHTLEVDPHIIEKLFPLIPKEKTVVAESGIRNYQDILFLKILGVSAVLIGEALIEAPDVKQRAQELMGW